MFDYSKLPEPLRKGTKLYIEKGVKPGSFLTAVICNDLKEAVGQADDESLKHLRQILSFFYWEVPGSIWGSPGKMECWMKEKRRRELWDYSDVSHKNH